MSFGDRFKIAVTLYIFKKQEILRMTQKYVILADIMKYGWAVKSPE